MKFALLSDTHYISRRMLCDPEDKITPVQIAAAEQAVLQAAKEFDTILIAGDLTDDGDRFSHEDFVEFLRSVKAQGKKIYVIFATHDFHHHRAFVRKHGDTKAEFKEKPWDLPYFDPEGIKWKDYVKPEYKDWSEEDCTPQLVEACSPEEIWDMYREFGRDDAFSVEESSFSYCIDLDEKTRVLMLNDIFRNEEALHDISATYTPSCFRWIKKMLDKAKEDGKFIFVCSHHPFIPTTPIHRLGTSNRNLRSPASGHTLADMGINLALTGHTHANNIGFLESPKGNILCDIATASPRFYPPTFRKIDLDGLDGKISYETVEVEMPSDISIDEKTMREFFYKDFYADYFRQYTNVKPPLNKIVAEGKVGEYLSLFRKKAGLTDKEFNGIKDKKLFDFLTDVIFSLVAGDGKFTPETPEYRLLMTVAAFLDSVIDAQPFMDIRGKNLQGYTIKEIVESLLFKNGHSDNKADIDFTVKPDKKIITPEYKSFAGDIIMAIICALAVPASLLLPPIVSIGLPVKTILKKIDVKKNPASPKMKY